MKIGLVFSNDWELFGNGSGDYHELQHRPLERLLEVFGNHGAKLTVMAEVGQQWAHQEVGKEQSWAREIAEAWESLLQEVVRQGHDVQLHLHPQWLNATYADGKWKLDYSQWAISSLSPETMKSVLKKGKAYLESVLQPVKPAYECIAFRAGAYCIEPSQAVIESLLDAGVLCDTSVTKGMHDPRFYDYRDAESNIRPWFANPQEVKYNNPLPVGLLEMPIYSYLARDTGIRRWRYTRNQRAERSRRYPLEQRPVLPSYPHGVEFAKPAKLGIVERYQQTIVGRVISRAIKPRWIQLDYDHLPARSFANAISRVSRDIHAERWEGEDATIPIVATGHTKETLSQENITHIFDELTKSLGDRLVYWTLTDAIRYWGTRLKENLANYQKFMECLP